MRRRRIALYGGTKLCTSEKVSAFVCELAYSILKHTNAMLVTGGFQYVTEHLCKKCGQPTESVDQATRRGAETFIEEDGTALEECLVTLLPNPEEERKDVEKIKRFRAGRIEQSEKGADARRYELVKDVDAIITVGGKDQTKIVLELALEFDKPVLPLPFTEGDSEEFWGKHKGQILEWFPDLKTIEEEIESTELELLSDQERVSLVKKLVEATQRGIQRKCLVLMPFNETKPEKFYQEVVSKAVRSIAYDPVRLNEVYEPGEILNKFLLWLDECDAVMADVTDQNPNVMYEIGRAHERDIKPLLLFHREIDDVQESLPFYLKGHEVVYGNIEDADSRGTFIKKIQSSLQKAVSKP